MYQHRSNKRNTTQLSSRYTCTKDYKGRSRYLHHLTPSHTTLFLRKFVDFLGYFGTPPWAVTEGALWFQFGESLYRYIAVGGSLYHEICQKTQPSSYCHRENGGDPLGWRAPAVAVEPPLSEPFKRGNTDMPNKYPL